MAQNVTADKSRILTYTKPMTDTYTPQDIADALNLPVSLEAQSQSTQQDAKRGRLLGQSAPRLYLAPSQEAAVGRFGRSFFTSPQGGIYMSMHLPLDKASEHPPTSYTLLLAASIVRAIRSVTGQSCHIKWVNDIYLKNKKIAGILTEACLDPETGQVQDLIMGVGLNFHIQNFPEDLKDKAGSLFEDSPSIRRQDLLVAIWQEFFQTEKEELLNTYRQESLVLGKTIRFKHAGQVLTGKALEIAPDGQLLVQLGTNQVINLSSGDISLIDWE